MSDRQSNSVSDPTRQGEREHGLAKAGLHKIHLVYEAEDLGAGTALMEGTYDVGVRDDIGCEFA